MSVFGAVGPSQGPYSVQVDGGSVTNYTALSTGFQAQSLLYLADGLSDGQHTVRIANAPSKAGQALSIDYAIVTAVQAPIVTSASPTTSPTSSSPSPTNTETSTDSSLPPPENPPESSNKGVSTGAIVAAVVGALALMAMLSFALMMFRRRRKNRKEELEPDMTTTAFPEPYSYTGRYIPPSQNMSGGYNPLDSTSTPLYPPSRPGQGQGREGYAFPMYAVENTPHADGISIFSGGQPAIAPRQSAISGGSDQLLASGLPYSRNRSPSDVSGSAPNGTEFAYSGISDGTSRHPAHGHSDLNGQSFAPIPLHPMASGGGLALHSPPPQPTGLIPPRKGAAPLPPTASVEEQRQFQTLSEEELRQRRMLVEGRAQDFGPVVDHPLNTERPLPELPPDYNQATEALNRS